MASTSESGLRTAILDAARHLITREGFRDVSMRMIARAAGCSVSSIYLYFQYLPVEAVSRNQQQPT